MVVVAVVWRRRLVVVVVMIVAMILLGDGLLLRLDDGGMAPVEGQHSGTAQKNSC